MGNLAIHVAGLGKEYRIGAQQSARYKTIRETIVDVVATPFRRAQRLLSGEAYGAADLSETIWALKNVNFDVNHGEVLGIIGRNGAGKSTLLKVLSRITDPTEGAIDLYGRVGAMLEVGTGFHPELTGRENIYLNGTILGMTRAEIDRKFDEIVDFSGVEQFIDTPVKHYSSGMGLRLGFAVAAHLEPEILVVDEVLAVGDAEFQKKCLGKMGDVAEEGRTVLFVSHNMASMATLCDRIIWMDKGQVRLDGDKEDVINAYLTSGTSDTEQGELIWTNGISEPGVKEFCLYRLSVLNHNGEISGDLDSQQSFYVEFEYEFTETLPQARLGITVANIQGINVFASFDLDHEHYAVERKPGRFISRCIIPGNFLTPTSYWISISITIPRNKRLLYRTNLLSFTVHDSGYMGSHYREGNRRGVIRPLLEWTTREM